MIWTSKITIHSISLGDNQPPENNLRDQNEVVVYK